MVSLNFSFITKFQPSHLGLNFVIHIRTNYKNARFLDAIFFGLYPSYT